MPGCPAKPSGRRKRPFGSDPKPSASVLLTVGLALFQDEQYDRAIEALEQARDLETGLFEPIAFLAMAYAQAGRQEQAEHEIEELRHLPGHCIQWYSVMFAHHRRSEDLARILEGLRKAGVPEWPYGYPAGPDKRLDGVQVSALTFGRTWQGQHRSDYRGAEPFLLQIAEDGTTAYRSPSSLRTGRVSLRDNRLCDLSNDFLLGRANCGYVYHDPSSVGGTEYQYVYVNAFSIMRFSVAD